METKTILFDLDGTLTDSGEGIINSVIPALIHFGIAVPDRKALGEFVGPPLHDTFVKYGIAEECTDEAIRIFRSRYNTVGKFENAVYPGILELLQTLKAHGHTLLIATSKPENLAKEVMAHFKIDIYFDRICGATLDRSRVNKEDVIAYLLKENGTAQNMIMVGDTAFDVNGAAAFQIPTIGVAWGYGKVADMQEAGAVAIANTAEELLALLET